MGFAAAVQPGPTQTFIISRTLMNGWRHSLPLAIVYLISDIPIVAVVLLLLKVIPEWMSNVLRLAGGLFLLYLAWGAIKTFKNYTEIQAEAQSRVQNLFKAVMINLLNPNPYLTWSLVMGPLLLEAWKESPVSGVFIVTGFYGAIVLTTAALIVLFGMVRRLGRQISRILVGISAAALAGFGIYQIVIGIQWLLA